MRPLITKAAVLAAFDGNASEIARALGVSRQYVFMWGRYLPELSARRVLEIKPELKEKVKYAENKVIRRPRKQTV